MKSSSLKERKMREPCLKCKGSGFKALLKPCRACKGTGFSRIRCSQCWKWHTISEHMGKREVLINRCDPCGQKYAKWERMSLEEREAATQPRNAIRSDGPLRISFVLKSGNRKTGPIPVTMTAASTCPTACPLMNKGCYAEQHMVAIHWRRLSDNGGISWEDFIGKLLALPPGQLWRHNEAGDLPGVGNELDRQLFQDLVIANTGKRGFTYTHKPLTQKNIVLFRWAVASGFTVNISTDSLKAADDAAFWGLPVTTVLPHDAPLKGNKTPAGRTIVVCPAETNEGVTCASCKLCQVGTRKSIVGFRAHGDRKKQISERQTRQLPLIVESKEVA